MNAYHDISRLSDAVVPVLNRLAEDPEGEFPRQVACEAIEALHAAVADITTREDISIMPRCPVGSLTTAAILGQLPYAVTPDLCRKWARDLDMWASKIDKIAASIDRMVAAA